MPIKTKTVADPYCDICGAQSGCVICANCGGVFCDKHSITIKIERLHNCRQFGYLFRALCDDCLKKSPDMKYIIAGRPANAWSEYAAEKGDYRAEMIAGIKESIDEADS